jgi:hypothetical protein
MLLFPIWFFKLLIIGGLVLCGMGAAALIVFLLFDSRAKRIW